ncbi:MAG: hypothetical protein LBU27_09880 [Candidatus Peribacteria bacterium]|nr:hypothetical protein [Candidatus Peribacteria bacterium]
MKGRCPEGTEGFTTGGGSSTKFTFYPFITHYAMTITQPTPASKQEVVTP